MEKAVDEELIYPELPEGYEWCKQGDIEGATSTLESQRKWWHWWYCASEGQVMCHEYGGQQKQIISVASKQEGLNLVAALCWTQNYGD